MKRMFIVILMILPLTSYAKKTISFKASDGLEVTGDLYLKDTNKFIVACHMAGASRGEYKNTAKWLNKVGYSVLAIDQRSGRKVNGVVNETAKRAKAKGLKTRYKDAGKDILGAIQYVKKRYNPDFLVLMGSSYSADWALIIAADDVGVDAAVAYSPGNYFKKVEPVSGGIEIPVYITAATNEIEKRKRASFVKNISSEYLVLFDPEGGGKHGSKSLQRSTKGYKKYRKSLKDFLEEAQEGE